jgi:hypothetical protein
MRDPIRAQVQFMVAETILPQDQGGRTSKYFGTIFEQFMDTTIPRIFSKRLIPRPGEDSEFASR